MEEPGKKKLAFQPLSFSTKRRVKYQSDHKIEVHMQECVIVLHISSINLSHEADPIHK